MPPAEERREGLRQRRPPPGEGLVEARAHRLPQIRQELAQCRGGALHVGQLLAQVRLVRVLPLVLGDRVLANVADATQTLPQPSDLRLPIRLTAPSRRPPPHPATSSGLPDRDHRRCGRAGCPAPASTAPGRIRRGRAPAPARPAARAAPECLGETPGGDLGAHRLHAQRLALIVQRRQRGDAAGDRLGGQPLVIGRQRLAFAIERGAVRSARRASSSARARSCDLQPGFPAPLATQPLFQPGEPPSLLGRRPLHVGRRRRSEGRASSAADSSRARAACCRAASSRRPRVSTSSWLRPACSRWASEVLPAPLRSRSCSRRRSANQSRLPLPLLPPLLRRRPQRGALSFRLPPRILRRARRCVRLRAARSRAAARSRSRASTASGSSRSSRSRPSVPLSRTAEPPVTEPPAWAISPVRSRAPAWGEAAPSAARAVIRSSATSVRPSSAATTGAISGGAETRSAATPSTPVRRPTAARQRARLVPAHGIQRLKGGAAGARLLEMGDRRLGIGP